MFYFVFNLIWQAPLLLDVQFDVLLLLLHFLHKFSLSLSLKTPALEQVTSLFFSCRDPVKPD